MIPNRPPNPLHLSATVVPQTQAEVLSRVLVQSVDTEMRKRKMLHIVTQDTTWDKVGDFLVQFYMDHSLYDIFIDVALKKIGEDVFTDDVLREFVLNTTDVFSARLCFNEIDPQGAIVALANAIVRTKPGAGASHDRASDTYCLIPQRVALSLALDLEQVVHTLSHNYWLWLLVMIYLNFEECEFYKERVHLLERKMMDAAKNQPRTAT